MMKSQKPTVHMVGHAHIDPTWLWRWTEGFEEVRATFRSALDRMDETPAFKFTASSACFYEWVKNVDPAMFEEIRARVKEGRWELAGGWWIEPDCNIPGGESFARHGLYAQRFFAREFGVRATVGFNPDSFGHAGTLPQLLSKAGIHYYVYMRPAPDSEMSYPEGTTFRWRANDGSQVLACNLQESYGSGDTVIERVRRLAVNRHLNAGQTHILGFYGVGNHGGGPTKKVIAEILRARNDPGHTPKVAFSTLAEFFTAFEESTRGAAIPVIATDLQHHARGCYSVHSEIKRINRECEHALMTAERFATACWLLEGQPYPGEFLEAAWKDVLYNQFHDILAGTSIESSYQDARDQLGAARHRAHAITNWSVQRLARTINTSAPGNTIVVINPLPWPVTQTVQVTPFVARTLTLPLHVVDDTETPVPCQPVKSERVGSTAYALTAELPALGYRCYHARSGAQPLTHERLMLKAGPHSLENDWWALEFEPHTGHLVRLYDKHHKAETLNRGNILACLVDSSDTWSHGCDEFRVEAGRFGDAACQLYEMGDVLARVRIRSMFDKSVCEQFVTLYRETDTIDCVFRVNWQQHYTMLKLAYETSVAEGVATYDTAYGMQVRNTDGFEEPGQKWVDLTGLIDAKPYGFAVLNDSKYGFDVCGGTVRVSVLRSPAYAHHDRARYDASLPYAIIDQGWQTFRVRLAPHAGSWQKARIPKKAWELNEPAFAHVESAHKGKRGPSASFAGTEADNVLLSVLKKHEDSNDLIVRGYETDGAAVATTLHLPYWKKSFPLSFAPHEIKTLRINTKKWTIKETNLLEE